MFVSTTVRRGIVVNQRNCYFVSLFANRTAKVILFRRPTKYFLCHITYIIFFVCLFADFKSLVYIFCQSSIYLLIVLYSGVIVGVIALYYCVSLLLDK